MQQSVDNSLFSRTYYLTPGECSAEQEMPFALLVNRLIEVATLHADSWGVGYRRLSRDNQAWVLSRMAVEMTAFPRVGANYTVRTWIESYNRHFSERNFEIVDDEGATLGYARTIWSVIDSTTRQSCDIAALGFIKRNIADRHCPIASPERVRNVEHRRTAEYTFLYTDIDFNRHVNTVRYICALLNAWQLDWYEHHRISRFDIAFVKEAYFGQKATIAVDDADPLCCPAEIVVDSEPVCKAKIIFKQR